MTLTVPALAPTATSKINTDEIIQIENRNIKSPILEWFIKYGNRRQIMCKNFQSKAHQRAEKSNSSICWDFLPVPNLVADQK
jgi:hypothetical protein